MGVPGDGVGRGGLGVPGMGWDRVKCGCLDRMGQGKVEVPRIGWGRVTWWCLG